MSTGYIPFDKYQISVAMEEPVTDYTFNRCTNRLLYNDKKLLEYINNVSETTFTSGICGEINVLSGGGEIFLDYDFINAEFVRRGFYPDAGISAIVDATDYCGTNPLTNANLGELLYVSGEVSGVYSFATSAVPIPNYHNYESHQNVLINADLADGQALVWDESLNLWTNKSVGGNFKTNLRFITFNAYDHEDISTYCNTNRTFYLSAFSTDDYGDLSASTGVNWYNLRSLAVETYIPNSTSSISATYLPNELTGVIIHSNSSVSNHMNKVLEYIPLTSSPKIDILVDGSAEFKIVGAFIETIRSVYQEIELLYIKGNTELTTVPADSSIRQTSGYINKDTVVSGYTSIWTNLSSGDYENEILTNWNNVFPINVSEYVTKSEITVYGNNNNIESNGFITVDWENNIVDGYLNAHDYANYWSFILTGQISDTPISGIFISNSNTLYPSGNNLPQISFRNSGGYNYEIERLPKIDYSFSTKNVTNIAYAIKNYKTYYAPLVFEST